MTQKFLGVLAIWVTFGTYVVAGPKTQDESAKGQEQLLKVAIEEGTGNYIFRYTAYDGTPVEIVFVPATKINPEVRPLVSLDRGTNLTTYEYQISNGEASKQELHSFKVKVIPPVENLKWPEGWYGLKPSPATNVVDWFQERGLTLVGGLVHSRGLLPGQSQSSFSFQSPNLPGIATAYFRGNTPDWPNPPGLTHEVSREMSKYTWWENDSVRKPTIGPAIQVSDLDPYDPGVHLQRLQTHLAEKVPEEMLPSASLRTDFDEGLARARLALHAGQATDARKHLVALRQQLAQAPETDISQEFAQALLINLDFILARLP